MLWKEYLHRPPRGLARLVGFLLTALVEVFSPTTHSGSARWQSVRGRDAGLAPRSEYVDWVHRNAFMWFLYAVVPLIYVLGMLGIAGSAAATITSEHEEDTWVSLTSTDLTGREIIFAKILGAMKRGRKFAELIVFLTSSASSRGRSAPFSVPC